MNSWSLSKIQAYYSCPLKYKMIYLKGIRQKASPAMDRGNVIHAKAEKFLDGTIRGMPNELVKLKEPYKKLKKNKPLVEVKLSVDDAWNYTEWKTGWCRGILDVFDRIDNEIIIIDHKTGRIYPKHSEQGEIYSCLASSTANDVKNYHVEFWYIDQGVIKSYDFSADEVEELKKKWKVKAIKVLSATRFPATPSHDACRWCHIRTDKGGTCHAWKKI